MVARRFPRVLALVVLVACISCMPVYGDDADAPLVKVTLASDADRPATSLMGRVVLRAQDGGILLEQRHGGLLNLAPNMFAALEPTEELFHPFDADELAEWLTARMGAAFGIRQTEHFVICTSASDVFTDYTADLLEEVYSEFFAFFDGGNLTLRKPSGPLPVVVFRRQEDLLTHAASQHPEQSFADVRGYYTVRFNQMYLSGTPTPQPRTRRELTAYLRAHTRHTETIVHETVHLLGYNSGLHTRLADNPLWFTEGLAAWFEPSTGRGPLVWTGPGNTNRTYVRHLKKQRMKKSLPISLSRLIPDNQAFLQTETIPDAYASSWAVVYYLLRRDRETLDQLAQAFQKRRPLMEISPPKEQAVFAAACETPVDRLETKAAALVRRLRIR